MDPNLEDKAGFEKLVFRFLILVGIMAYLSVAFSDVMATIREYNLIKAGYVCIHSVKPKSGIWVKEAKATEGRLKNVIK